MRRQTRSVLAAFLAVAGLVAAPTWGQRQLDEDARAARAEYIRSHYSKFEYRIPMRDGVRLFTAVYVPNDPSGGPHPMLMFRTPYSVGPYGLEHYREWLGPHAAFEEEGFIFVLQDVRGRMMSEGEFDNMRPHVAEKSGRETDESTDTYDTIEWLLDHVEGHNGKVGQWGISYPGFYSSAGMIDSHPALAAVSPQAPIADWFFDDMHRHGAFVLPLAFNFFSSFGQPRPEPTTERPDRFEHGTADGYRFFLDMGPTKNANGPGYLNGEIPFWNDIAAHPNYDDFWQSRNILPHLRGITAAVMVVGGWYDMEDLYGPLETYRAVEKQNPGISNRLVMGPWRHGGWVRTDGSSLGEASFGFKTADWYREHVDLAFFKHYLEGEGEMHLPEALVFETGANRWREFDAWPPAGAEERRLHLREKGGLSFEPPTAEQATASDSYPSDPAKPVPYTMDITTRWHTEFMTEDQRFAAWRPDVLVYESEVLEEDVTLAGPIEADLWVSTTGRDSDFIVKVIDVLPPEHPDVEDDPRSEKRTLGHRQQLVRGEVMRGRFRDGYETPKPFTPGEVSRVRFRLHDILHTFQRGHRIMVQVQSTWFPLIDRNPQSWVENIFEAGEDAYIKVENTIHRSPEHPSGLEVRVLPTLPRSRKH